jgi:hypothetical protein
MKDGGNKPAVTLWSGNSECGIHELDAFREWVEIALGTRPLDDTGANAEPAS